MKYFLIFTITKLYIGIQILQKNSFKGISFIDLDQYSKFQDLQLKLTLETIKYENKENQPFLFICKFQPTESTFIEMLKNQDCYIDWLSYELMITQTLIIVQQNIDIQFAFFNKYQLNKTSFLGYYSNIYTNIVIKIIQISKGECYLECQNNNTCQNQYCLCEQNQFGQDCNQNIENIENQKIFQGRNIYYYDLNEMNQQDFIINLLNQTQYSIQCIIDNLNPNSLDIQTNNSIYIQLIDQYQCLYKIQNLSILSNISINNYLLIQFYTDNLIYLDTQQNESDNSTLIIILSTILSVLIISIIFCFIRAKCKFKQQQNNLKTSQNQLSFELDNSKYIIDKYFPSQEYGQLKNRHSKHISMNQCLICLDFFNDISQIRVTYCFHIFHTLCFDQWMNIHKNCPNCRSSFDIESILKFYTNTISKDDALQLSSRMDDLKSNIRPIINETQTPLQQPSQYESHRNMQIQV